ncbi:MAG: hypothetical protein K0R29_1172 [Pseudobdellovibrio sp.]|jgi:pimeloyl-ACP methyl ester carboxylesterase|nr:hypothetical protein [Pseudobdellovibrio sp.]
MGPGANAQADEAILSSAFPNVFFWNQPLQKNATHAFGNLIEEAKSQVAKLSAANNGNPVNVIAHSFGGHIFHALSLQIPDLLKSCSFYGTGYDIPGGFFKLLTVMRQSPSTESALKEKMDTFLAVHHESKASDIWNYIGLIAQDPAFFRHYWPTQDLFNGFIATAAKTEPMDMESFQNILNDFLNSHFTPENLSKSSWQGPIEIHFGDKDPLIEINKETGLWKTIFPQAHIKVLKNSGHFAHLEKYLKA